MKKRCAIYTRKSTEEGLDMEFNSLDAQREACESYISSQKHEGWLQLPDNYNDGGFTGGNMERPALKRLIDDIKSGLIDTVIVYKVDRLSRSLTDFAKLIELFDDHKVSFVSVTQQFNTTTSMGRLTLNILLSFAQFEREVIGERIRDKLAASKRKGMWMGGVTPMGYVVKNRELVVEPNEAEGVRKIFDLFLMTNSPMQMVKMLPQMGVVSKQRTAKNGRIIGGTALDKGALYKILQNPIYIGKIKHKEQLYDGRHPALIDMDKWNKVRTLMQANTINRGVMTRRKSKAILMGLLKCGECECGLVANQTRKKGGRLYRYYICEHYRKGINQDCKVRNVSANEMEALILIQLQAVFASPEMIIETWREAYKADESVTETEVRDALGNIAPIWKELFPAEQQRILELMIEKVIVNYEFVDIRIRATGMDSLARELNEQDKRRKAFQPKKLGEQAWINA
ncbi:recombinase family protein [Bartonella queenslandensis]|uniref:recombinase family protein n=1 Tax=Bartonella queenslandensis TaxID=481138 RepID=UPI001FCBD003|nr:recombinase family protein [Bartonella queenslandensis]